MAVPKRTQNLYIGIGMAVCWQGRAYKDYTSTPIPTPIFPCYPSAGYILRESWHPHLIVLSEFSRHQMLYMYYAHVSRERPCGTRIYRQSLELCLSASNSAMAHSVPPQQLVFLFFCI